LWSHSKWLFSETPQKVSIFVCFDSFVVVLWMEVIFISRISTIHIEPIISFSKTEYLNPYIICIDLNSVLTRQTSEKVAYKPGLDYLLQCFLPSTFARIVSVLPEKFQKFLKLGELHLPPPAPSPARTPTFSNFPWSYSFTICSSDYYALFCRLRAKECL